jgi:hypothetical protein
MNQYSSISAEAPAYRRQSALAAAFIIVLVFWAVALTAPSAYAAGTPAIENQEVSQITSSTAHFMATINPNGEQTNYYVTYGQASKFESQAPQPEGVLGGGSSGITVAITVQGLAPNTTYDFYMVATNHSGTIYGQIEAFTTSSTQTGTSVLLDQRSWELVSPQNDHGAGLEPPVRDGGIIQAAADGGSIAYLASAPVEADPAGNRGPELSQILAERGPQGWISKTVNTPHSAVQPFAAGEGTEYRTFADDLTQAVVEPRGETLLSPQATERTPYLRTCSLCEGNAAPYFPLVDAENISTGSHFGGEPKNIYGAVRFISGTPDMTTLVLSSTVPLTLDTEEVGPVSNGLYRWQQGTLTLIDKLPSGTPAKCSVLGYINHDVRGAISTDGARIVWSTLSGTGCDNGGELGNNRHLFIRDVALNRTFQVDAVEAGASGEFSPEPKFQAASSDGSKIFFTDGQRLTTDSTAGGSTSPDLYEFELTDGGGNEVGHLTDLTVDPNLGESAGVVGLMIGASTDGSYVYYIANGRLVSGAARGGCGVAGAPEPVVCNLYVAHYNGVTWSQQLIATLSSKDGEWSTESFTGDLSRLTAGVSPNGEWLAFMSQEALTGYNTHDAVAWNEKDEEVYLYNARLKLLVCPSCNANGIRPTGIYDPTSYPGLEIDRPHIWAGHRLAGSLPGWIRVDNQHALYQPRFLSDSGRLFFASDQALVSSDVNGAEDVYEYEPPGVGSCKNVSGCVGLISAGTAGAESVFLDASNDGKDAFFLTGTQSVDNERESASEIYDAHSCGASPCAPVTNVSATVCAGSCLTGVDNESELFGSSGLASLRFVGSGNASAKLVKHGSHLLTPKQTMFRELRACRKQYRRVRKRRLECERRARRHYRLLRGRSQRHSNVPATGGPR